MNIRKLEDLSKDELIELIKQEREACVKLVPISVMDGLPEPDDPNQFIIYTESDDCCVGHFECGDWFDSDGFYMEDVTHWLPIPDIEE